ncbi:MAG TPA: hypothetical protein VFU64_03245 [Gaiellaceae bacterium]|nr:hypothetical protein [Gaiellaceae bacterium]
MTQHVRTGYRKHRKATWGFALVLALAVGAVFIPFAGAAAGKTYTLGLNPASQCASSTDGGTSTAVTITNTSRTQSLGSAEILFPANSVFSSSSGVASNVSGTGYVDANGNPANADVIGPLNDLNLSPGGSSSTSISVTFKAGPQAGPVEAVVKQANNFNDSSGGANLFTNPSTWPQLSIATCHYVFTQQPADAQTGAAQTVKVQLQSGTTPVAVSGSLSLDAFKGGTQVDSNFTGLTSTAQDATKTWVFNSVTGTVSGFGYTLEAGAGTAAEGDSNSFNIVDCMPSGSGGTCSTPQVLNGDGSTGSQVSGTGLASGFNVSFLTGLTDAEAGICSTNWGWQQMTFPAQPDGTTSFDGITTTTTSFANNSGYMLVTLYFKNSLYVQTTASQTNSIQICAGAAHTVLANGDPNTAWTGANGTKAVFDQDSGLYWGVLQRIPNCNANKVPTDANGIKSPALCAWGTVQIGGVDYRSATMIVPYDWDYQPKG